MDVCVRLFYVYVALYLGSAALLRADSPVQGVLPTVLGLRKWSETKRFTHALCSRSNKNKDYNHHILVKKMGSLLASSGLIFPVVF
jgi:hypothetical protein